MAEHATPTGPVEATRSRHLGLVGTHQDVPGAADRQCLVCGRTAAWRIERLLGSYTVCDWCESIIREYDARHPENHLSRHVRLPNADV
jgi:hypothetical protein